MAAVTICCDFGAQENKVSQFPFFPPSICHEMKVTNTQSETTECFFYLPILAISPSTSHFLITQCLSDFKINATKTKYTHMICKKETWVNSNDIGNKYHCFSTLKPLVTMLLKQNQVNHKIYTIYRNTFKNPRIRALP